MNRPRTTEHFPRMKDRAKGRQVRRQTRQTRAVIDALPAIAETFQAIGAAVVDTFSRVAAGWSKLIDDVFGNLGDTTQGDFALMPSPIVESPAPTIIVPAILTVPTPAVMPSTEAPDLAAWRRRQAMIDDPEGRELVARIIERKNASQRRAV